ncbi:hypothetical protein BNJ_00254 [Kaumoebavirus]|uniref:hypothetical protein n=1 Tax=Kaumoebavirus TaxID=1859492 RepID=UPI0009C36BA6|nr:hypothetical protein BNJ_00254 [Kaumoebavirus]ARA72080.1 hypothetical protein BNJ_00254 [Kaumoebavirus]
MQYIKFDTPEFKGMVEFDLQKLPQYEALFHDISTKVDLSTMLPFCKKILDDPRIMSWSWPQGDVVEVSGQYRGDYVIGDKRIYAGQKLWSPDPRFRKVTADIYNTLNTFIKDPKLHGCISSIRTEIHTEEDNYTTFEIADFHLIENGYPEEKNNMDLPDRLIYISVYCDEDDEYKIVIGGGHKDSISLGFDEYGTFDHDLLPKFLDDLFEAIKETRIYKLRKAEDQDKIISKRLVRIAQAQGIPIQGKPSALKLSKVLLNDALYRPMGVKYFGLKRRFRKRKF